MLIYFLYIFWPQQGLWISHLQWIIFPNRQMALPSVWSWCTASSSLRGKNIKIPSIPPRSHFSPHFCHLPPSPASPPPLPHFFNSSSFSKSFSPSLSSSRPVVQTALFSSAEWWLLSKHWQEKGKIVLHLLPYHFFGFCLNYNTQCHSSSSSSSSSK